MPVAVARRRDKHRHRISIVLGANKALTSVQLQHDGTQVGTSYVFTASSTDLQLFDVLALLLALVVQASELGYSLVQCNVHSLFHLVATGGTSGSRGWLCCCSGSCHSADEGAIVFAHEGVHRGAVRVGHGVAAGGGLGGERVNVLLL